MTKGKDGRKEQGREEEREGVNERGKKVGMEEKRKNQNNLGT